MLRKISMVSWLLVTKDYLLFFISQFSHVHSPHTHLTHTGNIDFICSDMDFSKLFDCKLAIPHHIILYCVSLFLFSLLLYYLLFSQFIRCQVNSYQGGQQFCTDNTRCVPMTIFLSLPHLFFFPDSNRPPIPIPSPGPADISSRPPMPPPSWQPIQRSGSESDMRTSRHPVPVPSSLPTISSQQQQQQRNLLHATSLTNGTNTTPSPPPVAPRRPPTNASTPVSNRPPLSVPPPLPHRVGGASPEPQLSSAPGPPIPTRRGNLSYSPGTKYVGVVCVRTYVRMCVMADTLCSCRPPVAGRKPVLRACNQPLPPTPGGPTYDTVRTILLVHVKLDLFCVLIFPFSLSDLLPHSWMMSWLEGSTLLCPGEEEEEEQEEEEEEEEGEQVDQILHKHSIGDCLQYDKSGYLLPFLHVLLIFRFSCDTLYLFLITYSPIMLCNPSDSLFPLLLFLFSFVSLTFSLFLVLQPTRSVEELLSIHGLGQYTNILLENGYDDINFMNDISLDDLKEIGVASYQDRERVSNYNRLLKLYVQQ